MKKKKSFCVILINNFVYFPFIGVNDNLRLILMAYDSTDKCFKNDT